jgi:archaellum component FlaC
MNCKQCGKSLPQNGTFVTCLACVEGFHYSCSGLSETTYNRMSKVKRNKWKCLNCRESSSVTSETVGEKSDEESEDFEVKKMLHVINNKLDANKTSVDGLKSDVQGLSNFYEDLKKLISDIQKENRELKDKLNTVIEENRAKDKKIEFLIGRVNTMEQRSRNCNLEIHGMDVAAGEREEGGLPAVVRRLVGDHFDVAIDDKAIEVVHRLPRRRPDAQSAVIVRCSSQSVRDSIINKRKTIVTNDALFKNKNENRLFICENLTQFNKSLLWNAKQKAKDKGWKYVWVKYGKIFAKKSDESFVLKLENERDLDKIDN